MVLTDVTLTSLPIALGVILALCLAYALALCACGKKKKSTEEDGEVRDVNSKHNSAALSDGLLQTNVNDPTGIHIEVDTAVTLLNTSIHSQNGTLHSRGNSVDLNKSDRYSGASAGSSPRPNTISRELPDIPVSKSHLPELPANGRVAPLDSHHRGHAQLPDIPTNTRASTLNNLDVNRGGHSHLPELPHNHPSSLDTTKGSNPSSSSLSSSAINGARPKVVSPDKSPPEEDMDDYDHINETKRKTRPRSDYDHVIIEGDTNRIIPAKQRRKKDDNDYAEVKNENIYEGVPEDVTVISVSKPNVTSIQVGSNARSKLHKVDSINDPYNRIKGDDPPYNKISDDPYNKIKVDDPYNRVKDDDPYNKVKDTDIDDLDPYDDPDSNESSRPVAKRSDPNIKLFDDPYALVIDEERNVSNQTDPYARVGDTEIEIDDPYNRVNDDNDGSMITTNIPEEIEPDYSTVKKEIDVEYAKVNKNLVREDQSNGNQRNAVNDLQIIPSTSSGPSDEYATVQKVRKFSEETISVNTDNVNSTRTPNASTGEGPSAPGAPDTESGQGVYVADPQTPPEPPRAYAQDTDIDGDHYNTLSASLGARRETTTSTEAAVNPPVKKREPPYNKLSVRESLASMNARIASNQYEYVSEVDNLYATVEGSSGDGVVVRPKSTNTEKRESTVSEYYAEIEGAAAAPAPPSLDSLHETAKHERRKGDQRPGDIDYYSIEENVKGHTRTPSGQGHTRTPSGHDHSITSQQGHVRTPSGGTSMTSSYEGPVVAMTTSNHGSLNFDYQDMEDEKLSDMNSEFDPNYETVEEAKAKVKYEEINGARNENPKVRNHIYEEADSKRKYEEIKNGAKSKTNSNGKIRSHVYEEVTVTNEARRVKQRVLSQHTYEEVTEVKDQIKGQGQNGKHKNDKEHGADVQKRKKGHERTGSGDLSWFGKRKSGEMKDKHSKDAKKKSEVKEKENKKWGDKGSKL